MWTGKVGLQCTNGSNLQDVRIHNMRMVSQAWFKFEGNFFRSKTRLLPADPQFTGTRSQPNGYDMFHINAVVTDVVQMAWNQNTSACITRCHSSSRAGSPSQSSAILAARVSSQIGFKAVWGNCKLRLQRMRVYLTCLFFILSIVKNLRILMRFILISLSILMILHILILISNRPSVGHTCKFCRNSTTMISHGQRHMKKFNWGSIDIEVSGLGRPWLNHSPMQLPWSGVKEHVAGPIVFQEVGIYFGFAYRILQQWSPYHFRLFRIYYKLLWY